MWDGALILTSRGPTPIQDIEAGARILTTSGESCNIASVTRHAGEAGSPTPPSVHMMRGCLGGTRPLHALDLSRDTPVMIDGALVAARCLVNGATIRASAQVAGAHRWHMTLEGDDAPAYRPVFMGDGFAHARNDPAISEVATRASAASKRRLLDVAATLGYSSTDDPCLRVAVDGTLIAARHTKANRYIFGLPERTTSLRLVSRFWIPAEVLPESDDERVLGVCVRRLVLDGHEIDMTSLGDGWDKLEDHGNGIRLRWTKGSALVPVIASRVLDIELYGFRHYWLEPMPR